MKHAVYNWGLPILGGLIVLGIGYLYLFTDFVENIYTSQHPISYVDNEDEVHVHSDFILFLDGQEYDLSDDKYQSKKTHILHDDIHLHDNNNEIIHRHGHEITLSDFMHSLGFELTDTCLTTDMSTKFCSDDSKSLQLFVNGEKQSSIVDYVNNEADQVLLFYGSVDDSQIDDILSRITDKSCIYSGTCPERGVAPPESCGLTCEL